MSRNILLVLLLASLALNVFFVQRQLAHPSPNTTNATTTVVAAQTTYEDGVLYPLLRVVDGDTIIVGIGTEAEYVRMIGIDTPEPNSTGGPECYANEATRKLKELVQTAGTVSLHFDTTQGLRDKYGRLLAYVELPDGSDLGERMIREGYAREYTYDLSFEREERYKEAEDDAVRNVRGLWSDDACRN